MNQSYAIKAPGANEIAAIHVDQLGYLPGLRKVAILSDPKVGYNTNQSYNPSSNIQLVDASSGSYVMQLQKVAFNNGEIDSDSGDRVWHADFSSFNIPGDYYILDVERGVRSYEFRIGNDVYNELLKHALKTMYYQRCGVAKSGKFTDNPCHQGDINCKMHDGNGGTIDGTEVDLSGGWHDAGDFNKYVGYAYPPVMLLLSNYMMNPSFWESFNTGLPGGESTNDIPDILDEVKWQLDWILKMQKPDGSVRHLVSSPSPGYTYSFDKASKDDAVRLYEDSSGQATCAALSMLSYGALVFKEAGINEYAKVLKSAAVNAWNWAKDNPALLDQSPINYQAAGILTASHGNTYGDTSGLGHRFESACYLHLLTGSSEYLDFIESNYDAVTKRSMLSGDHALYTHNMLAYANNPKADSGIKAKFLDGFIKHWQNQNELGAYNHNKTGWSAWGWNGNRSYEAYHAALLANVSRVSASDINHSERAIAGILNYIHGCNPLGLAYITILGHLGGDRYLTKFYHADRQIELNPPVGYLSGGPNAGYTQSNSPPANQPPLKSYDVTFQAPNDWEYLEGQISYQCKYISLLASVIIHYTENTY